MSRLDDQARALRDATVELVKKYQFRDRNETVAYGLSVSQTYALGSIAKLGPFQRIHPPARVCELAVLDRFLGQG